MNEHQKVCWKIQYNIPKCIPSHVITQGFNRRKTKTAFTYHIYFMKAVRWT